MYDELIKTINRDFCRALIKQFEISSFTSKNLHIRDAIGARAVIRWGEKGHKPNALKEVQVLFGEDGMILEKRNDIMTAEGITHFEHQRLAFVPSNEGKNAELLAGYTDYEQLIINSAAANACAKSFERNKKAIKQAITDISQHPEWADEHRQLLIQKLHIPSATVLPELMRKGLLHLAEPAGKAPAVSLTKDTVNNLKAMAAKPVKTPTVTTRWYDIFAHMPAVPDISSPEQFARYIDITTGRGY
ncbi:MAG: hypothetical protein COB66_04780 [Coxiella sp. (in: Bacteria)]|nr:MAG: hypothetical protein COB66_04780 [Coxiella sp. (in: g-proteobacteria)]